MALINRKAALKNLQPIRAAISRGEGFTTEYEIESGQ
jgi:hypothetical protein